MKNRGLVIAGISVLVLPVLCFLLLRRCTPLPAAPTPSPETETRGSPSPAPAPLNSAAVKGGVREDGSFSEGVLFIGDSLTYGLVQNYLIPAELIGDASYIAVSGMPLTLFFSDDMRLGTAYSNESGCVYSEPFYKLNYADSAALAGSGVSDIYFMLGSNLSEQSTEELYVEVMDYLLEVCPNAVIHLQTVPLSTSTTVNYRMANENIRAAAQHYVDCGEPRVELLDSNLIWDESCLTAGGIHLISKGFELWYQLIVDTAAK
ncbi:MAG: hypothetical protein RR230_01040 [Oscillospiraceae bacterium]